MNRNRERIPRRSLLRFTPCQKMSKMASLALPAIDNKVRILYCTFNRVAFSANA